MTSGIKKGDGSCELIVTCDQCHKEYPWMTGRSELPEDVTYQGKVLETRKRYTVKCPDCGAIEAQWMP